MQKKHFHIGDAFQLEKNGCNGLYGVTCVVYTAHLPPSCSCDYCVTNNKCESKTGVVLGDLEPEYKVIEIHDL